jgi:hypothetical protein
VREKALKKMSESKSEEKKAPVKTCLAVKVGYFEGS